MLELIGLVARLVVLPSLLLRWVCLVLGYVSLIRIVVVVTRLWVVFGGLRLF